MGPYKAKAGHEVPTGVDERTTFFAQDREKRHCGSLGPEAGSVVSFMGQREQAEAAAQRALWEWHEFAEGSSMQRSIASSHSRQGWVSTRLLRRFLSAWELSTVGRRMAKSHALRQLVVRLLPFRRYNAAAKALRVLYKDSALRRARRLLATLKATAKNHALLQSIFRPWRLECAVSFMHQSSSRQQHIREQAQVSLPKRHLFPSAEFFAWQSIAEKATNRFARLLFAMSCFRDQCSRGQNGYELGARTESKLAPLLCGEQRKGVGCQAACAEKENAGFSSTCNATENEQEEGQCHCSPRARLDTMTPTKRTVSDHEALRHIRHLHRQNLALSLSRLIFLEEKALANSSGHAQANKLCHAAPIELKATDRISVGAATSMSSAEAQRSQVARHRDCESWGDHAVEQFDWDVLLSDKEGEEWSREEGQASREEFDWDSLPGHEVAREAGSSGFLSASGLLESNLPDFDAFPNLPLGNGQAGGLEESRSPGRSPGPRKQSARSPELQKWLHSTRSAAPVSCAMSSDDAPRLPLWNTFADLQMCKLRQRAEGSSKVQEDGLGKFGSPSTNSLVSLNQITDQRMRDGTFADSAVRFVFQSGGAGGVVSP